MNSFIKPRSHKLCAEYPYPKRHETRAVLNFFGFGNICIDKMRSLRYGIQG